MNKNVDFWEVIILFKHYLAPNIEWKRNVQIKGIHHYEDEWNHWYIKGLNDAIQYRHTVKE